MVTVKTLEGKNVAKVPAEKFRRAFREYTIHGYTVHQNYFPIGDYFCFLKRPYSFKEGEVYKVEGLASLQGPREKKEKINTFVKMKRVFPLHKGYSRIDFQTLSNFEIIEALGKRTRVW